ncbi:MULTISPECIES: DUF7118 family protein [Halorussus]|uniref:DUF7118 family protein n=1 Tax=Halorussus TaxID=1070314 RepID=UPI00209D6400|nr:hypothetical protein [Halorussus vallis]USZ74388.1 hypothetical protein NGM07_13145 [Halorussus vallis]
MNSDSTAPADGERDDPVAALAEAADELERADDRIEEYGAATVDSVAAAYDEATDLLNRYEGKATGTGQENFKNFIEFQDRFAALVGRLDDDLPAGDAFEAANDRFDKRRLSESDFERARADLEPAGDVAALLDRRDEALAAYREARRDVAARRREVDREIRDREHLLELGEADLDAPVEELRNPISAYDDAVDEAFAEFKRGSSAREVLAFVAATRDYPLVEFDRPPESLVEYVREREAGAESIPKLLEYARYSNSKLDHYVGDPQALKRAVATNETYLERLDARPLRIDWPPRSAADLRWRIEELISVVSKFAPEETVARLREIRQFTRDEERFERLRTAARAREELSDDERERLAGGAVESELAELREQKETLNEALAEYPER